MTVANPDSYTSNQDLPETELEHHTGENEHGEETVTIHATEDELIATQWITFPKEWAGTVEEIR